MSEQCRKIFNDLTGKLIRNSLLAFRLKLKKSELTGTDLKVSGTAFILLKFSTLSILFH